MWHHLAVVLGILGCSCKLQVASHLRENLLAHYDWEKGFDYMRDDCPIHVYRAGMVDIAIAHVERKLPIFGCAKRNQHLFFLVGLEPASL